MQKNNISESILNSKKKIDKKLNSKKLNSIYTSLDINQRALGYAEGLTSTEPPFDMTKWYCKAFIVLGEERYSQVCAIARTGKDPKRLFGKLLKEELQKALAKPKTA